MPKLLTMHKDLVFLVSGDGDERGTLEESISRRKLQKSVRLLGRTDEHFLRALYNAADIFVMPNIIVKGDMEGFGRVLLEASLCELPIVATGIEGIKDAVVDGKNGILIDRAKDSAAFVAEIDTFITDEEKARTFGKASRSFTLRAYGWPTISAKYIECYNKLFR